MTSFLLKLIAIFTMLIDHSSFLFYGHAFSWMRCVGRLAFPLFAFQICEGYIHTHNLKKYYIRLLILAFVSQIPYSWFTYTFIGHFSPNIVFTLILGLFCISLYDYFNKTFQNKSKSIQIYYKLISLFLIALLSVVANELNFDYGYYGVLLIFIFYVFHHNKKIMNLCTILLTIVFFMPHFIASGFHKYYIILCLCTLIPILFINMYNGKKGKNFKLLFYIFYPLHITIICIISQLI